MRILQNEFLGKFSSSAGRHRIGTAILLGLRCCLQTKWVAMLKHFQRVQEYLCVAAIALQEQNPDPIPPSPRLTLYLSQKFSCSGSLNWIGWTTLYIAAFGMVSDKCVLWIKDLLDVQALFRQWELCLTWLLAQTIQPCTTVHPMQSWADSKFVQIPTECSV